jgi:hypothetical protein
MTRQQAIKALEKLTKSNDPEAAHSKADAILCDLLDSLACHDVVEKWRKVQRWYA